jgi:hypothetical protein
VSTTGEVKRRYTIVMDLWRAPGEDIEHFEGVESPDIMELLDEARFNMDTAGRVQEATYWLSQRGWSFQGAYDAAVLNRTDISRDELAQHLVLGGLQRQVVEEYDEASSHRPSRLVHLNPDNFEIEEWEEAESLDHDPDHCPLCLKGEQEPLTPPDPDGVLAEAEMVLAAARFRDYVRRAGLRVPEVLALFFGFSQGKQLTQEDVYPMIEQYKEYREELRRRGLVDD